MNWIKKWFIEIRIVLLFAVLLALLYSLEGRAEDKPLAGFKPLTGMTICRDVMLPCIPMIPKDTDLHFAVFSPEGRLIAITRIHDGKEETIWGKLPLRKGEKEI